MVNQSQTPPVSLNVTDMVVIQREGRQIAVLSRRDVKNFLCPKANDAEIEIFLRVCQAEGVNPYTREIYLVKMNDGDPAAIIFSIDVKLKIAENDSRYKGFEAGVIVKKGDALEYREGAFVLTEEKPNLVGGWAKVHRQDLDKPFYIAVNLQEVMKYTREGSPTKFWRESPANQVRKVALSRAFSEAFPNRFAGTSTDVEQLNSSREEGTRNISFTTPEGYPDWAFFWAKQKEKFPKGFNIETTVHQILQVESIKAQWTDLGRTLEEADAVVNEHLANKNKSKAAGVVEGEAHEIHEDGKQAPPPGFIRVEANCPICGTKIVTENEQDTVCAGCELVVSWQGSHPFIDPDQLDMDLPKILESLSRLHWNPTRWLCDTFAIPQKAAPAGYEQFTVEQKTQYARIRLVGILKVMLPNQRDLFTKEVTDRVSASADPV